MEDTEGTILVDTKEYELLLKIAFTVYNMPFGENIALPWCRESFPKLDKLMKQFEEEIV